MLDTAWKDAVSIFIALVFLPVYVSGAVRKLAIARIEELEALRNATLGTRLTFDRAGAVRAVVVQGRGGERNRVRVGSTRCSGSTRRSNRSGANRARDG